MSELTAAMAIGHEFKCGDKVYNVSLITQKIKAVFEREQFKRARDAASMMKDCMTQKEYVLHLKALNDDFISGEYGLESEKGLRYAMSNKGITLLCSLLFNVNEDEMLRISLEKRDELKSLLQVIIAESFGIKIDPEEQIVHEAELKNE